MFFFAVFPLYVIGLLGVSDASGRVADLKGLVDHPPGLSVSAPHSQGACHPRKTTLPKASYVIHNDRA